MISELKAEMAAIRLEKNAPGAKKRMHEIHCMIDELKMIPEYCLLVIDSDADYWRAAEGFKINGVTYHRLLGTSGGVKASTIIFLADVGVNGNVMLDNIRTRIDNGRDMNIPAIPAKLESYMGLTCSASKQVPSPRGVLIVDDCETHFKADYILLDDSESDEPKMSTVRGGNTTLTDSDGYGLISPSLALRWSDELGEQDIVGGFCTRNAFWKGMLFPVDFEEFARDVAGTFLVKDVWGNEHDIRDVDIVAPKSMLKLWESYSSIDEYLKCCAQNGYEFSVTKTVEHSLHESRELNYQFIQSYDMTDDEIEELIQPTIDDIAGVMGGDAAKAIIYMKGESQTACMVEKSDNDYVKALMVSDEVLDDPYVRGRISQTIRYRADRAKLGRVRVRGDFMVVSGDVYSFMQSVFGMRVTGLLDGGEVYSDYWDSRCVDEIVCFRAPMSCHNNIRKMRVSPSDRARHWYRYMKGVLVLNSWDMFADCLNGLDKFLSHASVMAQ